MRCPQADERMEIAISGDREEIAACRAAAEAAMDAYFDVVPAADAHAAVAKVAKESARWQIVPLS